MTETTGMLIDGKMSIGIRNTATIPKMRIRIDVHTNVYGRLSARWTSHTCASSPHRRVPTRCSAPSQQPSNERFELRAGDRIIEASGHEAELGLRQRELRRELVELRRDAGLVPLTLHAQIFLRRADRILR